MSTADELTMRECLHDIQARKIVIMRGHRRSTVVPADEFLRSEAGVWRPRNLTGPFRGEKSCDSENRPSLSLIEKYVWDWPYVKHLYKHTLCPFIRLGCRWLRELPPGKGLLPVSFHSEGTKTHPDLDMATVTFQTVWMLKRQMHRQK